MARSRASSPALPAPALARRLEEGVPRVVVLAGSAGWFRAEGLREVVRRVLPGGDPGAALLRYDARRPEDRTGVSAAIDDLRSASLFAPRRVVAIDNADAAEGPWAAGKDSPLAALAAAAMATSPDGSVLVLLTARPVKGTSAIPAAALAKGGALVVDCRTLYDAPGSWKRGAAPHDHELARFLAQRMQAVHGRRLAVPDAHVLTRLVGNELGELDAALGTLALYVGDQAHVTTDDIHEALGATRSDPAWRLTEAVAERSAERAFALLEAAFARGVPDGRGAQVYAPEALFSFLVAALHRTWRQLLAGAEALARGERGADVAKAQGIPSFRAAAWLDQCRRDPADLLARHAAFLEAEMGVKGGGGVPPRLALERLLARLVTT